MKRRTGNYTSGHVVLNERLDLASFSTHGLEFSAAPRLLHSSAGHHHEMGPSAQEMRSAWETQDAPPISSRSGTRRLRVDRAIGARRG